MAKFNLKHPKFWGGLLFSVLLVGIVIIAFSWSSSPSSQNSQKNQQTIASTYPENTPAPFQYPLIGPDPANILAEDDKIFADAFANQASNPNVNGMRFGVYAQPEMRWIPQTKFFYLVDERSFQGTLIVEPYFPIDKNPENFAFKVLLDGQEISFSTDAGKDSNLLVLNLETGKRKVINIKTQPISEGVHVIDFLIFKYIYNENPRLTTRAYIGQDLPFQSYTVFVAKTGPLPTIEFMDLGEKPSNLPGLPNGFDITERNPDLSEGIPIWNPPTFRPLEKINYTITLNNPGTTDREYCFIALLNYEQIPVQNDKKLVCGIVKGGYSGRLETSFVAPSNPGTYQFQVIRTENPLIKTSYSEVHPNERVRNVQSSSRILIQVK